MKISKKNLKRIIREEALRELWWGKKKEPAPQGIDAFSRPLAAAEQAMGEVVSALWGPYDDPPDSALLRKAQALYAELKKRAATEK